MNLKAFALATVIGLSVPVIAFLADPIPTVAQNKLPLGTFEDAEWSVTLEYYGNALSYYGRNKKNNQELSLRGAKEGGTPQRRLYIWSNGDTTYQVAWQPADPNYIRLQVIDNRGVVVLSRLLRRV